MAGESFFSKGGKQLHIQVGLYLAQALIAVGAVIPYIPQYLEIDRTGNPDGFSIYVSLVIVTSACLKIAYWFAIFFDTPLFIQNIFLVIMMLAMLELRVRVVNRRHIPEEEERHFLDWDWAHFWDYTNLLSYIQVLVLFSIVLAAIMFGVGWIPAVPVTMGYIACVLDGALALPQFYSNYKNGNTHGMSKNMVYIWAVGDFFKIFYYAYADIPIPFFFCAMFQFKLDLAILAQVYYYGNASPRPHLE